MNDEEEMIQLLKKIEILLRGNENYGQAEFINKLVKLFEGNSPDFEKEICSADMWGGSGAVWEVGWYRPDAKIGNPGKPTKEESEFGNCIIDLVDKMEKIGIDNRRAKSIKNTNLEWYRKSP